MADVSQVSGVSKLQAAFDDAVGAAAVDSKDKPDNRYNVDFSKLGFDGCCRLLFTLLAMFQSDEIKALSQKLSDGLAEATEAGGIYQKLSTLYNEITDPNQQVELTPEMIKFLDRTNPQINGVPWSEYKTTHVAFTKKDLGDIMVGVDAYKQQQSDSNTQLNQQIQQAITTYNGYIQAKSSLISAIKSLLDQIFNFR